MKTIFVEVEDFVGSEGNGGEEKVDKNHQSSHQPKCRHRNHAEGNYPSSGSPIRDDYF